MVLPSWFTQHPKIKAFLFGAMDQPHVAGGLAYGVFLGCQPFYGFHSLLALATASWFGFNPIIVLVGSHISTPPINFILIGTQLAVGGLVLHGALPVGVFELARRHPKELLETLFWDWTVGAEIVGLALGLVVYGLAKGFFWMRGRAEKAIVD